MVNAAHIKQVPGRKTDVKDCMWIAQCLEHGLLRGSFVPPAPIRELRDLTRHRKVLILVLTGAGRLSSPYWGGPPPPRTFATYSCSPSPQFAIPIVVAQDAVLVTIGA